MIVYLDDDVIFAIGITITVPMCSIYFSSQLNSLTHICVSNLTIIGSDNGLSPDRRQAIIWTNAGILFIEPFGTNFSEILIEILTFSIKKMRLKVSSGKWRSFCFGLNVLTSIHREVEVSDKTYNGLHLYMSQNPEISTHLITLLTSHHRGQCCRLRVVWIRAELESEDTFQLSDYVDIQHGWRW